MKLSIIVPIYNERETLEEIVGSVRAVRLKNFDKEIILIDDGSTDGTREVIESLKKKFPKEVIAILQPNNQGKGSAVRRGFHEASGDIILIQDADLEYNPQDYQRLIAPIIEKNADVVYGSRFVTSEPHRVLYNHHYMANKLVTFFSNFLSNLNLSDVETCYKVFSRNALDAIRYCLVANRFGIEIELTAQIAKHRLRVYEIGIAYNGRTYDEGKKITWKDGIAALWHVARFNLFKRK